jgi:sterol desaturase/sphingolipid hydroxylase (fatty acid hydroxylase superfamily)
MAYSQALVAGTLLATAIHVCVPLVAPDRHIKSLKSALGFFAVLFVVRQFMNPALVAYLANPWALETKAWALVYLLKSLGLALMDVLVLSLIRWTAASKLKYRENNPNAKGLERLEWIDYIFLFLNSVIETIFVHHAAKFIVESPHVVTGMDELGVMNTLVAFYLIFVVDDLLYAPSHRLMHWKYLYPYIHKHHHRQPLPERGYLDAGNEHPLEQIIGLGCLAGAVFFVAFALKVHAVALSVYIVLYAAMALLNHTRYDINFSFFGFEYSVGAHEMHHRHPKTNFAQYFMAWDRLMGTYKGYEEGEKKGGGMKIRGSKGSSKEE